MSHSLSDSTLVYIGTYTSADSKLGRRSQGIYRFSMDPRTGALTLVGVTGGVANPSWLGLDPAGRHLYSGSEGREHGERSGGAAVAFAVDSATGDLTRLNDQFMNLGYHVFIMSTQSPDVDATKPILYATVFVLLAMTFCLNALAVVIRARIRMAQRSV